VPGKVEECLDDVTSRFWVARLKAAAQAGSVGDTAVVPYILSADQPIGGGPEMFTMIDIIVGSPILEPPTKTTPSLQRGPLQGTEASLDALEQDPLHKELLKLVWVNF
jgi:hypothetical protein